MYKLDFGCGNGGFPGGYGVHPRDRGSWLLSYGDENTVAFDIDPNAIHKARSRIDNATHFMVADGKRLPFPDNSFDFVREWGVLHHISEYTTAVEEIARVLKSQGKFWLFETIDNDPFYAFCRTIVGNWKGTSIKSRFTSGQLTNSLSQYFKITNINYSYRPLILDLPSYFFEEYPFWVAGLYFQYYGSKLRSRLGLLPRFARHMTVEAVRI